MQLTRHLPFQPAVARSLHHLARLARRCFDLDGPGSPGFGADVPPEPHLWAELAPDLALRRISRQAEAHHIATTKGRP